VGNKVPSATLTSQQGTHGAISLLILPHPIPSDQVSDLKIFFFGSNRRGSLSLAGHTHNSRVNPTAGGPRQSQSKSQGKAHTRSTRCHTTLFQEVPSARTKKSMGVEPTHLLGVLQHSAAHTRLTEASRPNKGVKTIAHERRTNPCTQHRPEATNCMPMLSHPR
jgi:hypothetical protein